MKVESAVKQISVEVLARILAPNLYHSDSVTGEPCGDSKFAPVVLISLVPEDAIESSLSWCKGIIDATHVVFLFDFLLGEHCARRRQFFGAG